MGPLMRLLWRTAVTLESAFGSLLAGGTSSFRGFGPSNSNDGVT